MKKLFLFFLFQSFLPEEGIIILKRRLIKLFKTKRILVLISEISNYLLTDRNHEPYFSHFFYEEKVGRTGF